MATNTLRGLGEAMVALRICPRASRGAIDAAASLSGMHLRRASPKSVAYLSFKRSLATTTDVPTSTPSTPSAPSMPIANIPRAILPPLASQIATVPLTVYNFPALEPVRLELWSPKHLSQPLRRDLLHLAIVHEGDCERGQVNVRVKTRFEVHGSHRKLRKQKGNGRARVGDRMAPLLRGGGKTFGPRPRDFSTRMNRKVYDLAWRVALSYRYAKGELFVVEDGLDFRISRHFAEARPKMSEKLVEQFLRKHTTQSLRRMGFEGTTLFVAHKKRDAFFEAMGTVKDYGLGWALDVEDVDVKDLLSARRVVIERSALAEVIYQHQSDLQSRVRFADGSRQLPPPLGSVLTDAQPPPPPQQAMA